MKKVYLTAVLILTGLWGMSINAHAQEVDAVVVSVPFEFVAGGATLPAGQYRVSRVSTGVNRELAIRAMTKGAHFCFLWRSTRLRPQMASQSSASITSEVSTF